MSTPAEPASRTSGLAKAGAALRRLGPGIALLYAVHRLLQIVGGNRARLVPYAFYAQPIGAEVYRHLRDDPSTQVAPITPDDPVVREFPRPPAVLAERWASGSVCHVARVRDRFAGFIWISRGGHDEDEVRCRYRFGDPAASAWDYDVYVEPGLRLGRTLGRMWKAVDARLAADGVRWSFSRISLFNRSSISTHERLGARRVGRALFVVLGRLQIAFVPQAPYVVASTDRSRMPTVTLSPPAAAPRASSRVDLPP